MRLADLSPVKLLLPAIPLIVVAIAPASPPPPEGLHTIGHAQPAQVQVQAPTPTPPPVVTPDCRYPRPTA